MQRTPEQHAAIETLAASLCVDAGAGSGKTRVLVERIVNLIDRRLASLDEVVAITFTDKAAGEMKDRLRTAFHAKAPGDNPEEMTRWRDLERRVETARISTIHSFCAALLRENALHAGIDPDFSVLADAETTLLRNESVVDAIHEMLEAGDEGAVRAAAELGTSRLTETIIALINKRAVIERHAQRADLTDSAALLAHWTAEAQAFFMPRLQELRRALEAEEGRCLKETDAREQLRRAMIGVLLTAETCGEPQEARAQAARLLDLPSSRGARKANWDCEETYTRVSEVQKEVVALAGEYAGISLELEAQAAQLTSDVMHVYQGALAAYQEAKAARQGMDFDDMLHAARDLLRTSEAVRTRTARGIKFLLMDEFQDTDAIQLELAQLLVKEPGGPQFFFVGDAKQSIYDFRGAEVEVFQAARDATGCVLPLQCNFRSVPEVMEFVNDFFAQSGLLRAVEPEFKGIDVHREPAGECRVEFLIPEDEEGEEAVSMEEHRKREANLIAWRLDAMCRGEGGAAIQGVDGQPRPAGFGDVALIFRSMSNLPIYEQALRQRGIPYQVVAGEGFYQRQEIVDLLNLLALLVDPWDETALLGFLRGPFAALSDESLVRLASHGGLLHGFHAKAQLDDEAQNLRLEGAHALVDELNAHRERPLPRFIRFVLERTAAEGICLSQFLGIQKANNVRKLIDLAAEFSNSRAGSLHAFVQYVREITVHAIREGDAPAQEAGAVTLLTIHKSKGLEFPIVVVPDTARRRRGATGGTLAMDRSLGVAASTTDPLGESAKPGAYNAIVRVLNEQEEAEHSRILYVAVTRAQDWLLIGGAPKWDKGSWLSEFDKAFNLDGRPDGDSFGTGRWSAEVRRRPDSGAAPRARATASASLPSTTLIESRTAPLAIREPHRQTFAVTEVVGCMDGTPPQPAMKREVRTQGLDPLLRGTLVHLMFEWWDFKGELPWALLRENCPAREDWEALEPDLRRIAAEVAGSPFGQRMAEALAEGRPVRREAPFILRVHDALVKGTIDAVLDDGTIVDYKTGQYSDERHRHYEWQLRLYAAAGFALDGRLSPGGLLYYVDSGQAIEVSFDESEVAETLERAAHAIQLLRTGPPGASLEDALASERV